ncbi:hypothetical protein [uncultured Ruminococcus sp.]|uniref:hypothetical protein n=1 Tax=uncultured Ruminococcus sp. TaxID=165186 RepID=UPI00345A9C98
MIILVITRHCLYKTTNHRPVSKKYETVLSFCLTILNIFSISHFNRILQFNSTGINRLL